MKVVHTGIIEVIQKAKNESCLWADTALAEINLLTGMDYQFARLTKPDRVHYEIREARP